MACENGHNRVVQDKFSKIPGIKRMVPGDCYCLDCRECLPYNWNHGKPVPVRNTQTTKGV